MQRVERVSLKAQSHGLVCFLHGRVLLYEVSHRVANARLTGLWVMVI